MIVGPFLDALKLAQLKKDGVDVWKWVNFENLIYVVKSAYSILHEEVNAV